MEMEQTSARSRKRKSGTGTTTKRKEPSEKQVIMKKSKKVKKASEDKKEKEKEFWVKLYTVSSGVRVIFSDEALGPFKTKDEVVEAVNGKVEEIENDYGIDIPEEDLLKDRREKPPARGKLLVIKNCQEEYHFDMTTKKPKIFDGNDSDACPF